MKIAFLSAYSGMAYRGVETYVHELANRLFAKGHEITVFQNGPKIADCLYKTVSVGEEYDSSTKSHSYTPPFINYLSRFVKRFTKKALSSLDSDVDVVVSTNGRWQSVLCKLWAKKNNVSFVIPGQSGAGFDDFINLWTFPDVFVSLTDYQRSWARARNPFVKLFKVPNGVDLEKFGPNVEPLKIDLPRPVVLHVGALVSLKGQKNAIKAISKLEQGSLLLIGKGEDKEKLEQMGKDFLPKRFKIMSFDHEDIPRVYAAADLFTFPTASWESFGIVMVEAMASGLAVVANDDPIRREIVGNAGLFVDPSNTDAYSETLRKALSSKWGDKPRRRAEKYNWDIIAEKYEKLFKELVK